MRLPVYGLSLRRLLAYALIVAGSFLLTSSTARIFLLAFGRPAQGAVQSADKLYSSARGSYYRIHYTFRAGASEFKGSASAVTHSAPTGSLAIRHLPFFPLVHGPDDIGYLAAGLVLRLIPGLLLPMAGLNLLLYRPLPEK